MQHRRDKKQQDPSWWVKCNAINKRQPTRIISNSVCRIHIKYCARQLCFSDHMPVDYVRTINGKVFYQAEDLFRMSCVVCLLWRSFLFAATKKPKQKHTKITMGKQFWKRNMKEKNKLNKTVNEIRWYIQYILDMYAKNGRNKWVEETHKSTWYFTANIFFIRPPNTCMNGNHCRTHPANGQKNSPPIKLHKQ